MVDNMAHDFYIPILREAVMYKRAVGFFSSSVLIEIAKGIQGLVKNGGHIRIIASPRLTDEDIEAIRYGYAQRENIIHNAIRRELKEPANKYQKRQLNFLANLIADGILDLKIAITESDHSIGMYHEKVGIIEDREGNKIAFSGSMNETANALLANYESVDVFKSWNDIDERVKIKEAAFDGIWYGMDSNIHIVKIEELSNEIVEKYRREKVDYRNIRVEEENEIDSECFFRTPSNILLYEYQKKAIVNWMESSGCGIFDMATGTGKTYTGLAAVSAMAQALDDNIAVIIVVPYRHLVDQWVEDINRFGVRPIIAYSYPGQNWRKEFNDSVNAYNCGAVKNFCIITTIATFSGCDFQNILLKFRKNFCFVADEAHNLGSKKVIQLLPKKARYRLALSATMERHRDENGTESLRKYFGNRRCISFSLKQAIKEGFLTPYYYHPIIVYLNKEELQEYNELTHQIGRVSNYNEIIQGDNSYLDMLLIKRARIIAGCNEKIDRLIEVLSEYKNCYNMLIYCGATKYDCDAINDEKDLKQIDEISRRLYKSLNIKVRKFTSEENPYERKEILDMFVHKEIQAITAIKCLDEGVNIPAVEKAFILASSTNPKEYVQRRGRVLRKFPGKEFAEIYDFITLPRKLEDVKYLSLEERKCDLSLVQREFVRMLDFADTARNPSEIDVFKRKIEDTYRMNITKIGGEENECN